MSAAVLSLIEIIFVAVSSTETLVPETAYWSDGGELPDALDRVGDRQGLVPGDAPRGDLLGERAQDEQLELRRGRSGRERVDRVDRTARSIR